MQINWPSPGRYIIAVSGGVDSMVLLHLLWLRSQQESGWELTVAHFDHGMRPDSGADRRLVQAVAEKCKLPFMYKEGHLGEGASEATARTARYAFLREVWAACDAQAIITAHHQDDLLETVIINMLRGTGRKGLTSLESSNQLLRPLLKLKKELIIAYAKDHGLQWREDSTNADEQYLRNYVRRSIMPRLDAYVQQQLLGIVRKQRRESREIDDQLRTMLPVGVNSQTMERQWFNSLPHVVAREIMAAWLRQNGIRAFDRKTLERLTVAAKVSYPGKEIAILGTVKLLVGKRHLALAGVER